ncbi:homocysteine S-methyltransferase family protein [Cognatishimia sp. F0-27]|uniref:homocysteine S-methyltransferase family protein n=1 Tax=Cognatishimia sp. F0-27 TaxID=2816855 RepID=UPI001D0C3160|nr:homocysteine S-methyltransferase family protein [Cognatishimia sp. F0-27]MCC1492397.1 homocysteine S-methyltransferase family protein [Cognatishimia sp. F0-27]
MARYRQDLPQMEDGLFLTYVGMETDLIFTQGIDLPGFASYPLLDTEDGRALLEGYYRAVIETAREAGAGVILESPTWVANRDRATQIGYGAERLAGINKAAIAHMQQARDRFGDLPTVLSANIGPRDDAYAPSDRMSPEQADAYHAEQIAVLSETDVDVISGYTLAYPEEAIGIARAARRYDLPVVISFTVETDGRLPTGATLEDAIGTVDAATGSHPAYYMINCAHPDHFESVLEEGSWMQRIRGLVANASRSSHAELDAAEVLDAGDPAELGRQLAGLRQRFGHISVLGGCCGTDMRHIACIASRARSA